MLSRYVIGSICFMVVMLICNVNSIVDHRDKLQLSSSEIHTKTVCENENAQLKCSSGMIKVIDAFFGRNSAKKCYDGPSAEVDCPSPEGSTAKVELEVPEMFMYLLSGLAFLGGVVCVNVVVFCLLDWCNYKRACTVPANIYFFTTGCALNVSKYLDVSWTCVEGPPYLNHFACEHEVFDITCGEKFIKIHEAFYGRNDVDKCNDVANVTITTNTCLSKVEKTTFEITKRCEDTHRCRVKVENNVINQCCCDPCPGQPKFLDVNYSCLTADEVHSNYISNDAFTE